MAFEKDSYTDFHTHLDGYREEELLPQLAEFNGTIITAAMDPSSYAKNVSLAVKAKALGYKVNLVPVFGIHPAKVLEILSQSADLKRFDSLCNGSNLIGEIGMDLCWYKDASVEQQEYVLRYFLNHCNEKGKYCVIHTKDAEEHIARILQDYPKAKPIIHWYDGPENIYREFIERGYYFTFGCETCRSEHIKNLLRITPKDKILAETDNPESEPWLGGTDSSVNLIKRVYVDIGNVLGLNSEEARELINRNAQKVLEM